VVRFEHGRGKKVEHLAGPRAGDEHPGTRRQWRALQKIPDQPCVGLRLSDRGHVGLIVFGRNLIGPGFT
jgi:hypothetical protein